MKINQSKISGKGIGFIRFLNDTAEAISKGTQVNLTFAIPEYPKNNLSKLTCSKGEIKPLDGKNKFQLLVNQAIEPNQEFDIDFTVAITVKPESIVDVDFELVSTEEMPELEEKKYVVVCRLE